jgi:hypothetical protein
VTAWPPGRGPGNRRKWLFAAGAHVLGLPAGAMGAAFVWTAVGTVVPDLPGWPLAVLAAGLALITSPLVSLQLRGSPWRIPREWSRFGDVAYAGIFGVALGTGMATALASPGLYLLVAWGVVAGSWHLVWPVFLAFAVGRALPFAVIVARVWRHGEQPFADLHRMNEWTQPLATPEAVLLATLAGIFAL